MLHVPHNMLHISHAPQSPTWYMLKTPTPTVLGVFSIDILHYEHLTCLCKKYMQQVCNEHICA